jgi:hypothetical protein
MERLRLFLYITPIGFGVTGISQMPEPVTMLFFGFNLICLAGMGKGCLKSVSNI